MLNKMSWGSRGKVFAPGPGLFPEMLATAIDDDTRLLQLQEIFISKNVLKVVDPSGWNSLSYQGKQKEFRDTCFAIHEIVVHKLYTNL